MHARTPCTRARHARTHAMHARTPCTHARHARTPCTRARHARAHAMHARHEGVPEQQRVEAEGRARVALLQRAVEGVEGLVGAEGARLHRRDREGLARHAPVELRLALRHLRARVELRPRPYRAQRILTRVDWPREARVAEVALADPGAHLVRAEGPLCLLVVVNVEPAGHRGAPHHSLPRRAARPGLGGGAGLAGGAGWGERGRAGLAVGARGGERGRLSLSRRGGRRVPKSAHGEDLLDQRIGRARLARHASSGVATGVAARIRVGLVHVDLIEAQGEPGLLFFLTARLRVPFLLLHLQPPQACRLLELPLVFEHGCLHCSKLARVVPTAPKMNVGVHPRVAGEGLQGHVAQHLEALAFRKGGDGQAHVRAEVLGVLLAPTREVFQKLLGLTHRVGTIQPGKMRLKLTREQGVPLTKPRDRLTFCAGNERSLLDLRLAQLRSRGLLLGTHSLAHPRGRCVQIQVGIHAPGPKPRQKARSRSKTAEKSVSQSLTTVLLCWYWGPT